MHSFFFADKMRSSERVSHFPSPPMSSTVTNPQSNGTSVLPSWCHPELLPWWSLTTAQCIKSLFTSDTKGLSEEEANNRFKQVGPNELPQEDKKSMFVLFLEQFEDLLVRILLFAALISFILALSDSNWKLPVSGSDLHNFVEPLVIMLILIFNAVVSVWQERSAEGAIEALRQYQSEVAKVWRHNGNGDDEGRLRTLKGRNIVPGDIVDIAVGDRVPADIRIIDILSTTLWVDQSLLTGESVSVLKQVTPIGTCSLEDGSGDDFKECDTSADPTKLLVVNQDKTNLLFSGTTVVRGRCRGVVVATGRNTEIGKIRKDIVDKDDKRTPLTIKLDEFSEYLSKIILIVCIAVWIININHFSDPVHDGSWLKGAIYYFKIAVALAVAAIPEGLPAVITTCLALGTTRMAKKNAIVRTLPSVETLGCTSVICSDKTGTLTTNQMLVSRFAMFKMSSTSDNKLITPVIFGLSGSTYSPIGNVHKINTIEFVDSPTDNSPMKTPDEQPSARRETLSANVVKGSDLGVAVRELVYNAVLCNDASLSSKRNSAGKIIYEKIGEATEAALVVFAEKLDVNGVRRQGRDFSNDDDTSMICTDQIRKRCPRLLTLEFTRERKSMGACVKYNDATDRLMVKGAPEAIINRCTSILTFDGELFPLCEEGRASILKWFYENAALRCLAFAYVDVKSNSLEKVDVNEFEIIESNMTFTGMVGMLDPPRPEVIDAIRLCKRAGIHVKMITGDNQKTAEHIARQIGLMEKWEDPAKVCYTGSQFISFDEQEQIRLIDGAKVFARVDPAHKSKIIECLQRKGEISAMTGDGVNDAPALKRAEIGIAMGSGTAVAKGASDMVLADDNFSSIVAAVSEGRAIFNNMKQFIRYLISSNIGEVVCVFLTAALGLPEALIPVQLLWVNLVTDGLPATALGFNPPDIDIMHKPPRKPSEPLITTWLLIRYGIIGIYVGLATVLSSCWWYIKSSRGPHITMNVLRNHFSCSQLEDNVNFQLDTDSVKMCSAFISAEPKQAPMTMALSVLVTIEMLNALNSLSENQSMLAMPPWRNWCLIGACGLSMLQHLFIVYMSPFNAIFHTCPLTTEEWAAVFKLSIPVVLIDESIKLISRHFINADYQRLVTHSGQHSETMRRLSDQPPRPRSVLIELAILVAAWAIYAGLLATYPLT